MSWCKCGSATALTSEVRSLGFMISLQRLGVSGILLVFEASWCGICQRSPGMKARAQHLHLRQAARHKEQAAPPPHPTSLSPSMSACREVRARRGCLHFVAGRFFTDVECCLEGHPASLHVARVWLHYAKALLRSTSRLGGGP
eukprot:359668-Chlamydomonas_euryale.AAC.6